MLKIPNGSCFYRLSAHEDTQHINRRAEESSSEVLGPVSKQLEKQKTYWVKESVFGGVETN